MHLRHIYLSHSAIFCCAMFCSVNADLSRCVPDKDITAKYVINAGHTDGFGYNVPALEKTKRTFMYMVRLQENNACIAFLTRGL